MVSGAPIKTLHLEVARANEREKRLLMRIICDHHGLPLFLNPNTKETTNNKD